MKITNLEINFQDNSGCNNGNYPVWTGTIENGKNVKGVTCNCLNGCSNTDRLENYDPILGTCEISELFHWVNIK